MWKEIINVTNNFTPSLTHWGRVTHISVNKLTIIGSDNGLSPGRRQAIIWTNTGILLIAPLGTNFSEILIWIQTFSSKKMHLKMTSAKLRPFCLGLNVLTHSPSQPRTYSLTQWLVHLLASSFNSTHSLDHSLRCLIAQSLPHVLNSQLLKRSLYFVSLLLYSRVWANEAKANSWR